MLCHKTSPSYDLLTVNTSFSIPSHSSLNCNFEFLVSADPVINTRIVYCPELKLVLRLRCRVSPWQTHFNVGPMSIYVCHKEEYLEKRLEKWQFYEAAMFMSA